MAAITLAEQTIVGACPVPALTKAMEYILEKYEVIDPETSTTPTVEKILEEDTIKKLIATSRNAVLKWVTEVQEKKTKKT